MGHDNFLAREIDVPPRRKCECHSSQLRHRRPSRSLAPYNSCRRAWSFLPTLKLRPQLSARALLRHRRVCDDDRRSNDSAATAWSRQESIYSDGLRSSPDPSFPFPVRNKLGFESQTLFYKNAPPVWRSRRKTRCNQCLGAGENPFPLPQPFSFLEQQSLLA